jgi:uncharacterized membrane protein
MKKIPKVLYKFYISFYNSIAFYPLIITSALFILAMVMSIYETTYKVKWIEEYSFLWVKGHENARGILTTIIAGVISLTVFSFSMVMIVLNQASTNFSPRVIPGLITQRSHQIVLGFYIGTIIYVLILLHNIKPEASDIDLPQLGIFLGELLSIFSLSLFVYFIHSISKAIQIDNVISKVYKDTSLQYKDDKKSKDIKMPDKSNWLNINSIESGYYRSFKEDRILDFASDNDLIIYALIPKGSFILKGQPFLIISKRINEKKLNEEVFNSFVYHQDEYINENPVYGFKQLSEIAVKALSPGINDPGSAIRVIDFLVLLFEKRMNANEEEIYYDKEDKIRLIQAVISFDQMLYNFFGPIRVFGKTNVFIITKLLEGMKNLLYADRDKKYSEIIISHTKKIIEYADKNIYNSNDREKISNYVEQINNSSGTSYLKFNQ